MKTRPKAKIKENIKEKIVSLILILFFVCPLIVILSYFKIDFSVNIQDLGSAVLYSSLQGLVTSLICLSLALLLVPQLAKYDSKRIQIFNNLSLLPSIMPSIFTLLIVFSLFKKFPFGFKGITIIFCTIYFGFAVVALLNAFNAKVRKYSATLELYKISVFLKYKKIYLPILFQDILNIAVIIFLGCVSSLSVPLVAGLGKIPNLEVLIYESVFINGNWSMAAVMMVIQAGFVYLISKCFSSHQDKTISQNYSLIKSTKKISLALIVFAIYIGFYIGGYAYQVTKALVQIDISKLNIVSFLNSATASILLSVLTIFIFSIIVSLLIYLLFKKFNNQFVMNFLLPSTTLVGFSLYLLFNQFQSEMIDVLKIAIGLNLIFSLIFFKSYIMPEVKIILGQIQTARIYSLDYLMCFKNIIFPQIKKSVFLCFSVLFLYSFCEFALIKAAGSQVLFSGIFLERLISSYRLDLGFIYSFFILCICGLFFQIVRLFNVKN